MHSLPLQSNCIQNEKKSWAFENGERHHKYVDQGFIDVLEGAHVRICYLVALKTKFEAKYDLVFNCICKETSLNKKQLTFNE